MPTVSPVVPCPEFPSKRHVDRPIGVLISPTPRPQRGAFRWPVFLRGDEAARFSVIGAPSPFCIGSTLTTNCRRIRPTRCWSVPNFSRWFDPREDDPAPRSPQHPAKGHLVACEPSPDNRQQDQQRRVPKAHDRGPSDRGRPHPTWP